MYYKNKSLSYLITAIFLDVQMFRFFMVCELILPVPATKLMMRGWLLISSSYVWWQIGFGLLQQQLPTHYDPKFSDRTV